MHALSRPHSSLMDVSSTLRDFVITTFDVDISKLAAFLPAGLAVDTVELAGRGTRALVSAVSFLNTRFHVHFAPFLKLECGQTNYRAYVRQGTQKAVWFFGTGLDSVFVHLPRAAWKFPWHRMHVRRSSQWQGDRLQQLQWNAEAPGCLEHLELRGTGRPLGRLDGFAGAEETHAVLTHPLVGYLRRRDGGVVVYGVWHAPLVMEEAEPVRVRYELFERLGLIEPHQRPHSVLVQQRTDFLVRLPPRPAPLGSA